MSGRSRGISRHVLPQSYIAAVESIVVWHSEVIGALRRVPRAQRTAVVQVTRRLTSSFMHRVERDA